MTSNESKPATPLNILLWSPQGSGKHYNGPGSFAFRMYSSIAAEKLSVSLVHGNPAQRQESRFVSQKCIAGWGTGTVGQLELLFRGKELVRRVAGNFDVFHGLGGFHSTVSPAFEAERSGLPAVVFMANHRTELTDKTGLRGLLQLAKKRREMLKSISCIIAMSDEIYDELIEYAIDPRRVVRIPMGVDIERFRPVTPNKKKALRDKLGLKDIPTIIFVGGICERKRPHLLVEAIAIAMSLGKELQLILVGPEGEEAYVSQMRAHAESKRIGSNVHWIRHKDDVEEAYQAADIFCLPSSKEGMPAALVEAMSCGLAIVVTEFSSVDELVVAGKAGVVVDPDSGAIADALVELVNDESKCKTFGSSGRRHIQEFYSLEYVAGMYEKLFHALKSGNFPTEKSQPSRFPQFH